MYPNKLAHPSISLIAQDPYGNYVVGYVLDMSNPRFSDAIIRQFLAHVCHLATQKFSSNVMEKVCQPVNDCEHTISPA